MNRARFSLWLYGLLGRAALPAALARMWWRGRREPLYRGHWAMRLGWWRREAQCSSDTERQPSTPLIWLHAVSLGETRAAQPLVDALRRRWPAMQLLLTTGTATGWEAGRSLLGPGDRHGWIPLDTPGATRRFLKTHRPDLGVLMETETWPQLLAAAQAQGVPMVLANARLSERSLAKALRWPSLMRPMVASLSAILAQSEVDAQRLVQAGADPHRVQVCGHLKYDLVPAAALLEQGLQWHADWSRGARRIVLAASWREGEDEPLLQAWQAQIRPCKEAPEKRPLLVLVPRHPQRFDEVEQMIRRHGLRVVRRSAIAAGSALLHGGGDAPCEVLLGDSLGEMPAYYASADVALLGGSFAPLGGQNLIEAAACGCPLLMGPHTFNFTEASAWAEEEGAARRLPNLEAAVQAAWALTPAELQSMAQAGRRFTARHGGATARMVDRLSALLDQRADPNSGLRA